MCSAAFFRVSEYRICSKGFPPRPRESGETGRFKGVSRFSALQFYPKVRLIFRENVASSPRQANAKGATEPGRRPVDSPKGVVEGLSQRAERASRNLSLLSRPFATFSFNSSKGRISDNMSLLISIALRASKVYFDIESGVGAMDSREGERTRPPAAMKGR